jgi:NADH dehydrogenase/NADH:ubiquinone oxidoreductase subunit G
MKKNWNKQKDKFNKKLNSIFFCDLFKKKRYIYIYIYIKKNWNKEKDKFNKKWNNIFFVIHLKNIYILKFK